MEIIKNADMREYTSFRAGGQADTLCIPETTEELTELLADFKQKNQKYVMLGNGSNTLVRDEGIRTPVIKLGKSFGEIAMEEPDCEGKVILTCGAAALMLQVAKQALMNDLTGFENLSGIPGSLGGALFMNAGAYGSEMKDIVVSAEVLSPEDGEVHTILAKDMDLRYRGSRFTDSGEIILTVKLCLTKGEHEEIAGKMRERANQRSTKQPITYPSAGSFFKRPEGYFAGALIQEAGLKGLRVGGAEVSQLHAGFVINRGGATAQDILDLMHLVQNVVWKENGVMLEPEVRIIGGEEA